MHIRRDAAIVAGAAAATFANSLANGFAFDDEFVITGNTRVQQLADQAAIWLTPYWPEFGEAAGLYRPLAIFAYALQWGAGGGAPWVFHATSVLLHIIASVLALVLLRRLVSSRAALFGALLFAVHPVHVEAVANVVGQAELLAGVAVLGACVLYTGREHLRLPLPRLLAISALYALAMLAKESAIVMPLLLVALDAAMGRYRGVHAGKDEGASTRPVRKFAALALPAFVLAVTAAAYLLLRISVIGSLAGTDAAPSLPFLQTGQRWLVALQTCPEYLRLLVFPIDLSADYSPAVIDPASQVTAAVVIGALLLSATAVLALTTVRRPATGLAAAWFLIAILPVSNLIVPIGVVLAERTLYVPSFAIAIAAGFIAQKVAATRTSPQLRTAMAAGAAVLLAFAVRSAIRNPDWKDTQAYWNALIRDHPESYHAQWGMAGHMIARGDQGRARVYLEMAVDTWSRDAVLLEELGVLYLQAGEPSRAVPHLESARQLGRSTATTSIHLGLAYVGVGRFEDALSLTVPAAGFGEGTPAERAAGAALRAQALEGLGRYDDAADAWKTAVETMPGRSLTWWLMTARALARIADVAGANAAADSATTIAGDTIETGRLERLRAAIAAGCYRRGGPGNAASPCVDPLEEWSIVTPTQGILVRTGREAR
jgi:tetratricopeptide (TPR) repeat protein